MKNITIIEVSDHPFNAVVSEFKLSRQRLLENISYPIRELLKTEDSFRKGLEEYVKFLKLHQEKIKKKNKKINIEELIQELQKLSKEISVLEEYRQGIKDKILSSEDIVDLLRRLAEIEGEFIRRYDSFIKLTSSCKVCSEILNAFLDENASLDKNKIMGYIVSPIQRPPRYKLLLEEIIKRSAKSPDHKIQEIHRAAEKLLNIVIEKNSQVDASAPENKSEQKTATIRLSQFSDLSDKEKKENSLFPQDLFKNFCDRFQVKKFTEAKIEDTVFNSYVEHIKEILKNEISENAVFVNVKSKLLVYILEERYKAGKLSLEDLEKRKLEIRSLVFQKRLSHRSVAGSEEKSISKNINSYFNNLNVEVKSEIKPQIEDARKRLAEAEAFATQKKIPNLEQVKGMLTTFRDSIISFFQSIRGSTERLDSKPEPPSI